MTEKEGWLLTNCAQEALGGPLLIHGKLEESGFKATQRLQSCYPRPLTPPLQCDLLLLCQKGGESTGRPAHFWPGWILF